MKYILAALAALVIMLGLWGYAGHNQAKALRTDLGNAQVALQGYERATALLQEDAQRIRKTLTARAVYAEALLIKRNTENASLKEALGASPDWATAPIPDGVRKALGDTTAGNPFAAPSEPAGGLRSAEPKHPP